MNNNHSKRSSKTNKSSHKNYLAEITKKYKDKLTEPSNKFFSSQNSQLLSMGGDNSFQSLDHSTLSNKINKTSSNIGISRQGSNVSNITFRKRAQQLCNSEDHIKKFNEYKNLLDKKMEALKQKLAEQIKEEQIKIDFNKFKEINRINIKTNPFIIFIQMFNTKDLYNLLSINREVKSMIIDAIAFEVKTFIANKFIDLSKEIFSNYSFYLGIMKYIKEDEFRSELVLIVKTQITGKSLVKKSIVLRYSANYPCDKSQMIMNHFVFDIKNTKLNYWIMKEYTSFIQDTLNKAYLQQVMQFRLNDFAEFTINIITNKGLMNIRKFHWHTIKHFHTPKDNFYEYSNENCFNKEIVDFNMIRYCELELLKGSWNDIELMEHAKVVKETIYEIFNSQFKIKKILFDDVGYYIFKIYLEANKEGELICEKGQIGIKIKILGNEANVSNEVKKNNLIYDRKNELQLHIGDQLVFYLSKNK